MRSTVDADCSGRGRDILGLGDPGVGESARDDITEFARERVGVLNGDCGREDRETEDAREVREIADNERPGSSGAAGAIDHPSREAIIAASDGSSGVLEEEGDDMGEGGADTEPPVGGCSRAGEARDVVGNSE